MFSFSDKHCHENERNTVHCVALSQVNVETSWVAVLVETKKIINYDCLYMYMQGALLSLPLLNWDEKRIKWLIKCSIEYTRCLSVLRHHTFMTSPTKIACLFFCNREMKRFALALRNNEKRRREAVWSSQTGSSTGFALDPDPQLDSQLDLDSKLGIDLDIIWILLRQTGQSNWTSSGHI